MKWRRSDSETIARCVAEVEARTEAEVVVVARRFSGDYRDVDFLFGAGVAWLALIAAIAVPYDFDAIELPLPLAAIFAGAAMLCRVSGLARLLTTARRQDEQVRREAEAQFVRKRVHATRAWAAAKAIRRAGRRARRPGPKPWAPSGSPDGARFERTAATDAFAGCLRSFSVLLEQVLRPARGRRQRAAGRGRRVGALAGCSSSALASVPDAGCARGRRRRLFVGPAAELVRIASRSSSSSRSSGSIRAPGSSAGPARRPPFVGPSSPPGPGQFRRPRAVFRQ
jgi:hypothetical protein